MSVQYSPFPVTCRISKDFPELWERKEIAFKERLVPEHKHSDDSDSGPQFHFFYESAPFL